MQFFLDYDTRVRNLCKNVASMIEERVEVHAGTVLQHYILNNRIKILSMINKLRC